MFHVDLTRLISEWSPQWVDVFTWAFAAVAGGIALLTVVGAFEALFDSEPW